MNQQAFENSPEARNSVCNAIMSSVLLTGDMWREAERTGDVNIPATMPDVR
jgi:hypothetical protein